MKVLKMHRKFQKWVFIFCGLLLFIVVSSCEKEEFTLPVKFNLSFSIKSEPVLGGAIEIDEIGLALNSIDIQGYREQGEDVFFTRNYDKPKAIKITPTPTGNVESFDIPQGTYNPLTFSLTFQPDDEEEDILDDIEDWFEDFEDGEDLDDLQEDLGDIIEDYLEDITPCLMVKGTFKNGSKTQHLLMVINNPLSYKIIGKNKNGSPVVTLDKNFVNTGDIQFDPAYWFMAITPEMLSSAFIGIVDDDDDQEYIFLSKHFNSSLYSILYNRIEESTTLTINK